MIALPQYRRGHRTCHAVAWRSEKSVDPAPCSALGTSCALRGSLQQVSSSEISLARHPWGPLLWFTSPEDRPDCRLLGKMGADRKPALSRGIRSIGQELWELATPGLLPPHLCWNPHRAFKGASEGPVGLLCAPRLSILCTCHRGREPGKETRAACVGPWPAGVLFPCKAYDPRPPERLGLGTASLVSRVSPSTAGPRCFR